MGTELEFMLFADSFDTAWRKDYRGLEPANLYNVDYSMLGTARVEPVLRRIRNGMAGAGMIVESAKGECNLGQHEIAFRYADALTTCDNHTIYKTGAKEIADQAGMALTFMAKFDEREGNSCHIHISLRGDRRRRRCSPATAQHGFSPLFEHFVAGQQACLRELCYLFAPNINSYKRYAAGSFAPTAVAWGLDNRTCALRVVGHGPSLRVENRVPGGDMNPYLGVAALIAAGLHGIENELPLEPELVGNAYASDAAAGAVHAARGGRAVRRVRRWPPTRSGPRWSSTTRTRPGWSWPRSTRRSPTGSAGVASNGSSRSPDPLIGLTAYCERAAFGVWDVDAVLLPRSYTDMVADAGGVPVLLPPRVEAVAAVDRLDAVVLAGGADIAADRYGAPPHPRAGAPRPDRDATELAVLARALDRGIPVLGVCRGAQLLNVALGGSLVQHLPEAVGHDGHNPRPGVYGTVTGRAGPGRPGRRAARADGRTPSATTTRPSSGWPTGWWSPAGPPTARSRRSSWPTGDFVLGVQWHPEQDDLRLFTRAGGRRPGAR